MTGSGRSTSTLFSLPRWMNVITSFVGNPKSVTYVAGHLCYLSPRLLSEAGSNATRSDAQSEKATSGYVWDCAALLQIFSLTIHRKRRMPKLRILAVALLAACRDAAGPANEGERLLSEQHSPATDTAARHIAPRWSADGKSVYHLPQPHTAARYDAETGEKEVLTMVSPTDTIVALEAGATRSDWYTLQKDASKSRLVLRHHLPGTAVIITERATGARIRRAANGDLAYVVYPDSVFVWRPSTRNSRFVATSCRELVAVAPAGDGVVCNSIQAGMQELTRLTVSAPPTIVKVKQNDGYHVIPQDAVWTTAGIHITFASRNKVGYETHPDPSTSFLTPELTYPETPTSNSALAGDGKTFAFVSEWCVKVAGSYPFYYCDPTQMLFYLSNPGTRSTRRIGVHAKGNPYDRDPALSLSPDGSRVAYVMGWRLYIMSTNEGNS
jgi:hypothetical protein